MFGYNIREIIFAIVLFYLAFDTFLYIINGIFNKGPGGCSTRGWFSGIFFLNNKYKPPRCLTDELDEDRLYSVGRYRQYALKKSDGTYNNCLYEAEIDNVVDDIKENLFVEGFTVVELFAYIIIPIVTLLSIGYWVLSNHSSRAEWTFWLMVLTIIYTGLTTLVKETADIDINPPSQTSCLTYVGDSLGFTTGDELQYTFMARKQDGSSCMIEGTFLGTPDGGIEPEDQPSVYRGDAPKCSAEELPLY